MVKIYITPMFIFTLFFNPYLSYSQDLSMDISTITLEGIITDMDWHPDGNSITISSAEGLWIVPITDSSEIELIELGAIRVFKWNKDGTVLAIARWDGVIELLETSTWQSIHTLELSEENLVAEFDWSNDGQYLAAYILGESEITIWDTVANDIEQQFSGVDNVAARALAWHPTESDLAVGFTNGNVVIRELGSEQPQFVFNEHPLMVTSVAWHPDGEQLASGGANLSCASVTAQNEDSVFVWNANNGDVVATLPTEQCGNHNPIGWNQDGNLLAYSSQTGGDEIGVFATVINIVDIDTSERVYEFLATEDNSIVELEWRPNSNQLAYRKDLRLNTANSPRCTQQFVGVVDFDNNSSIILEATQPVCSESVP